MRLVLFLVLSVAAAGCGGGANKNDGSGGSGGITGGGGTGGGGTGGNGGITGDSGVNPPCSSFTACGGNLVAAWRFASACGLITSANCPQGIAIEETGSGLTYTFRNDGTFSFSISAPATLSEKLHYPLACISGVVDAGSAQACEAFENAIRDSQNADGGSPVGVITSFTCAMEGNDTCACDLVFTYTTTEATAGTYTTSGNQIILDAPDAGTGPTTWGQYCVSGSTFTLRQTFGDGGGSLVATYTK
jgi:hypothetical protein